MVFSLIKCTQIIASMTGFHIFAQEIPLLHVPLEVDSGTVNAKNINTLEGKGFLGGLRGEAGGAGMISSTVNTLTAENMHLYNQYKYSSGQEEMDFRGTGMMTGQDFGFSRFDGSAFDGMALSNHFLEEYYSSVSICGPVKVKMYWS